MRRKIELYGRQEYELVDEKNIEENRTKKRIRLRCL